MGYRASMTTYMIRDVPEDVHRAFRVDAARRGMTMRALVIQLMEEHLQKADASTSALVPTPTKKKEKP